MLICFSSTTQPVAFMATLSQTPSTRYFQNVPMDWKSDPLDQGGGPSPKAPQVWFLWVALHYRYKRDLHKESRITPRVSLLNMMILIRSTRNARYFLAKYDDTDTKHA